MTQTLVVDRHPRQLRCIALLPIVLLMGMSGALAAPATLIETPMLSDEVAAKKLPPVKQRLPENPMVVAMDGKTMEPGQHGGTLNMLIGRARDVRMLVVYGYARLVGYDRNLALVPDILQNVDAKDDRVYTMKLRQGHKWSDGKPFTSEDFRYFWEDVANDKELSPAGPPSALLVEGQPPKVEILDKTTVRYTWAKANPDFLPLMAGASPLLIYRPAHYLKQFHKKYNPKVVEAEKSEPGKRSWAAIHNREDNMYQFDNPKLPTLQPWLNTTKPPTDRFIAVRNAFFHRIDENGRQLPYIDKVVLPVVDGKLIPAKAGAGESDLQARDIQFNNYTFLKKGEKTNNYKTFLWRTAKGSHLALFPNLNVADPVWKQLFRDVRFRRALSLSIDRAQINQVLYFGLASESNNTVVPDSPLYRKEYQTKWAKFDRKAADKLLDEVGLKKGSDGVRRLSDGRPLEIIVETAGESTEQTDVLELVRENWRDVGIKLFSKPSQRDLLRNRVFSGEAMMSVWQGLDNGMPNADTSPDELAPKDQAQLQWPKFGQFYETAGKSGEAPDFPEAIELMKLLETWRDANREGREKIWHRMLAIHADQQFSIGIVNNVMQPVVVTNNLKNVPEKGLYNWDPGAFFGIYRPDTFWFTDARAGTDTVLAYTLRRVLLMIPTLLVISFVTFIIIQLPPGDYLTNQIAELRSQGDAAALEKAVFLRQQFGLDRPFLEQYGSWVGIWPGERGFSGLLQGDWGWSFEYNLPVLDVVGDRLLLSFVLNITVILFTWAVSFPIGFYAATHQYSWGDHGLSFIGYLGLATPNFLLALVLMYFANVQFGLSIGGMMDPQYLDQPMSWPKFMSVMSHLWIPVIVIGTSGTAGMIRRLRANLLDELQKQYVVTARAKGMPSTRLLIKYPLRMALNPFIADIGNLLPSVISGSAIVSVVLSLQTEGPMLLDALQSQDQYLAGSFLMFLALLTVMGMFVSDLLLAALDPRIRLSGEAVQ